MKLLKKLILVVGIVSVWNSLLSGKDFQTALVLSGGGARGFAHIGVIRALEEVGFYPDVVIGTSMGAIVGVFYSCGMSADEIERYMKSIDWYSVLTGPKLRSIKLVAQKMYELPGLFNLKFDDKFNLVFPRNILSIQGIQNIVFQRIAYWEFVCGGDFDNLFIPFRAVATDIKTGRTIVLDKGSLSRVVAASSAFPLIFAPVKIDSLLLVDGGLTNNVPCDVARSLGADFIIAVDITSKIERLSDERLDLFKYMGQTINTLSYYADTKNLLLADVLIRPELKDISSTDFDSIDVLIKRGYLEARKYLPVIKKWVKKRGFSGGVEEHRLDEITITKIVVKNNKSTKDFVIRTEFGVKEGNKFNLRDIREGYENLLSTGLFNSVWISIERVDKKCARLILDVEENRKLLLSVGANYYSERDSKAFLKGIYNNILGLGFYSELYGIMSNYYSEIGFNVINPGIFTSNIIQLFRLYYQYEKLPFYRSGEYFGYGKYSKAAAEFSSGMQVKRVGLTSVGVRYLRYNILREGVTSPQRTFSVRSVFFRIFVDSRDDIDLPQKGRKNSVEFEYRFVENKEKFYRLDIESTVYETYNKNTTYYTYLRVGIVSGVSSVFDKLRLGGMSDLPGFKEDELLGQVVFCLGLGFTRRLKANIFYNAYFAYGDMKENIDSFNWLKARKGLLNGFVFKTPIGPIRVEYGWNFGKGKALYVSVGHNF